MAGSRTVFAGFLGKAESLFNAVVGKATIADSDRRNRRHLLPRGGWQPASDGAPRHIAGLRARP